MNHPVLAVLPHILLDVAAGHLQVTAPHNQIHTGGGGEQVVMGDLLIFEMLSCLDHPPEVHADAALLHAQVDAEGQVKPLGAIDIAQRSEKVRVKI